MMCLSRVVERIRKQKQIMQAVQEEEEEEKNIEEKIVKINLNTQNSNC